MILGQDPWAWFEKHRGAVHFAGTAIFLSLVLVGRLWLPWLEATGGFAKAPAPGWSEAIYLASGLVLLWYTIETWKLRREAQRQTKMQIRPFLSISIRDVDAERRAVVQNLGLGMARNVRVSAPSVELHREFLTHLAHLTAGAGPPGDREWIITSKLPQAERRITLTYGSLAGAWYKTIVRVANGIAHIDEDEEIDVPAAEHAYLVRK